MGYCGSGATFASFSEAFDKTVSRGPDDVLSSLETVIAMLGIFNKFVNKFAKNLDLFTIL